MIYVAYCYYPLCPVRLRRLASCYYPLVPVQARCTPVGYCGYWILIQLRDTGDYAFTFLVCPAGLWGPDWVIVFFRVPIGLMGAQIGYV